MTIKVLLQPLRSKRRRRTSSLIGREKKVSRSRRNNRRSNLRFSGSSFGALPIFIDAEDSPYQVKVFASGIQLERRESLL